MVQGGGLLLKLRIYGLGVPITKRRPKLRKSSKKAKVAQRLHDKIETPSHFQMVNDEAHLSCVKCVNDSSCSICSQFMEGNVPLEKVWRSLTNLCTVGMPGTTVREYVTVSPPLTSDSSLVFELSGDL